MLFASMCHPEYVAFLSPGAFSHCLMGSSSRDYAVPLMRRAQEECHLTLSFLSGTKHCISAEYYSLRSLSLSYNTLA